MDDSGLVEVVVHDVLVLVLLVQEEVLVVS